MKQEIRTLINSLYSGSITKKQFIKLYFGNITPNDEYCLTLIHSAISNKDSNLVEEFMVLIFTGFFNLGSFTSELCSLLLLDWHYKHEDIAVLLKEIQDTSTVDCLYNAAELQFEYLNYDDTYQFGRKCIKALSAIGDEKSINKLWLLSKSEISKLSEYAKKELNYKGLL